jgi:hypothetical protein
MKSFIRLLSLCCLSLGILPSLRADIIANWTFESSAPSGLAPAGGWLTNISAEVGVGTASGWHSVPAAYSPSPGNGSLSGFGVTNGWAMGDFYQFVVSTVGMQNLSLSYEQSSSSGGPISFHLEYGTDGQHFTHDTSGFFVKNGNWNSSVHSVTNTYIIGMSGLTDLNNQNTVYFRIVDDAFSSPAYADDRLDNVLVVGTPIPEPSLVSFAVSALAIGLGLLRIVGRTRHRFHRRQN